MSEIISEFKESNSDLFFEARGAFCHEQVIFMRSEHLQCEGRKRVKGRGGGKGRQRETIKKEKDKEREEVEVRERSW